MKSKVLKPLKIRFLKSSLVLENYTGTLKTIRQLAEHQQHGYAYLDGVLVHFDSESLDAPVRQVMLPTQRCEVALNMAHSDDLGGHYGVKHTLARLYKCI